MKQLSENDIRKIIETSKFSSRDVLGYAVDTRLMKPGDLFFALRGTKVDGHEFLKDAAEKKASLAIVNANYSGPDYGLTLLQAPDVNQALQTFAKVKLASLKTRVIAVTGSLGKTTTKDFLFELLNSKYKVARTLGNNNSQIGLPLSILNHVQRAHEFAVLEMGMTHPGQISKLLEIAPPSAALVTMVALVHACNFECLEQIAKAKSEIFSHPNTEFGIYHYESNIEKVLEMSGKCQKFSFSTLLQNADFTLKKTGHQLCITEKKTEPSSETSIYLPALQLPGIHNSHNFLAAAAMARKLGLSWQEIGEVIPSLKLPEKRLEFVEKFGALFVNDAYNASEVSIKAALDSLPEPKPGCKRIAVLGEILELGKFSKMCHSAVGEYALTHVDCMLCYGEGCLPIQECWKTAGKPVVWVKERFQIVPVLREMLQEGDVVLLKGSRAKSVCKVLEEL